MSWGNMSEEWNFEILRYGSWELDSGMMNTDAIFFMATKYELLPRIILSTPKESLELKPDRLDTNFMLVR